MKFELKNKEKWIGIHDKNYSRNGALYYTLDWNNVNKITNEKK